MRFPTCSCGVILWPVTADVRACPTCDWIALMPSVIGADVRPMPGPYDWASDPDNDL